MFPSPPYRTVTVFPFLRGGAAQQRDKNMFSLALPILYSLCYLYSQIYILYTMCRFLGYMVPYMHVFLRNKRLPKRLPYRALLKDCTGKMASVFILFSILFYVDCAVQNMDCTTLVFCYLRKFYFV
jgi:hypothetical protein